MACRPSDGADDVFASEDPDRPAIGIDHRYAIYPSLVHPEDGSDEWFPGDATTAVSVITSATLQSRAS